MGAVSENIFGIIIGLLLILISALAHAGLKVVKPQEALVLTLFGNYTGTIKEPGFSCAMSTPTTPDWSKRAAQKSRPASNASLPPGPLG